MDTCRDKDTPVPVNADVLVTAAHVSFAVNTISKTTFGIKAQGARVGTGVRDDARTHTHSLSFALSLSLSLSLSHAHTHTHAHT